MVRELLRELVSSLSFSPDSSTLQALRHVDVWLAGPCRCAECMGLRGYRVLEKDFCSGLATMEFYVHGRRIRMFRHLADTPVDVGERATTSTEDLRAGPAPSVL